MSAGKGHTTRPFSWAKWDASKLWKKPNMTNTPRTDEILALLPGGQTCDPQAVADALRPAIAKMEREFDDWRALIESEVANLRAELANERALADRLAHRLELSLAGWDSALWTAPMDAAEVEESDEALAAYQQARNPAQTTGEGAE